MKHVAQILSALALCIGATGLRAANLPPQWRYVAKAADMMYYLDTRTMEMRGPYWSYWVLVAFNHAKKYEHIKPYKSARILYYADCAAGTQDIKTVLQFTTVKGDGEPVWASHLEDEDLVLEPLKHGSLNERLMLVACSAQH